MDDLPTKKKKKKSATTSSAEDAIEAKMAAKKKKSTKSSKAEDALEAKIKKKVQASRGGGGGHDDEEEKVEEGLSVYSSSDDDEETGYNPRSSKKKKKSKNKSASTGVPVDSSLPTRGGGDVRNRPPPTLAAASNEPVLDPIRQAELKKQAAAEAKKKKLNPRYAELHETGQWGGLNKYEKYGICLLIVGAITAAIVLGIKFGSGGEKTVAPTNRPTLSPSISPSSSPTISPTDNEYRANLGLELMIASSPKLSLPQTPNELIGASSNPDSTPQEIAAEFIIYEDPMELPALDPRFMERYALVVFYYANGGCSGDWIDDSNWMVFDDSDVFDRRNKKRTLQEGETNDTNNANGTTTTNNEEEEVDDIGNNTTNNEQQVETAEVVEEEEEEIGDHCNSWHGIICDLKKRVIEINLSKNYITGKIPMEFSSLTQLSTLDLSNNALVGTVPYEALSMPSMYTVQLNNNVLEGEFPFEEVKNGATILDNLWIQENTGLTGTITEAYCTMNSVTLDCDNFNPQPVYAPDDSGDTTFQKNCYEEIGSGPKEYTCNFDEPVPFEKPGVEGDDGVGGGGTTLDLTGAIPAPAPAAICGVPAVGS